MLNGHTRLRSRCGTRKPKRLTGTIDHVLNDHYPLPNAAQVVIAVAVAEHQTTTIVAGLESHGRVIRKVPCGDTLLACGEVGDEVAATVLTHLAERQA